MQKQQSQISSSTRHRYSQHNMSQKIGQYWTFKSHYQNTLSVTKIEQLKKMYPHAILGRTQSNKVVVLDRIGCIKLSEINKIIDDETFMGYIFQRLVYLSENVLKQKQQVIWIIDLSGKVMQLASKKTYAMLQKVVQNCQKYFPGLLYKLYFINTPMLFDTAWSKISTNINEHTMTKIFHLNDELDELFVQVDKTLLPKYLGGNQSDEILLRQQCSVKQDNNNVGEDKNSHNSQNQQNEQQQIDFGSLKAALSGLKLGNHPSVANTPLNTEADDVKQR